jgi:hypothetical protein
VGKRTEAVVLQLENETLVIEWFFALDRIGGTED